MNSPLPVMEEAEAWGAGVHISAEEDGEARVGSREDGAAEQV